MKDVLTISAITMAVLSIVLFYTACIVSWNYSKNNRFESLLKNSMYKNILWRCPSNSTPIYWLSWSVIIRIGLGTFILVPLCILTKNTTWPLVGIFVVDYLFTGLTVMVINDLTTQYIQNTRQAIDASKMLI